MDDFVAVVRLEILRGWGCLDWPADQLAEMLEDRHRRRIVELLAEQYARQHPGDIEAVRARIAYVIAQRGVSAG